MTTEQLRVTALMTAPRHGITLARNYIELALKDVGIPLVVSGGVFYGQCMQRMLEDAIAADVDVAITVDSDSLFTSADVTKLLRNMLYYELDVNCALQCRRGKPFPLLTIKGSKEAKVGGQPFEVTTAHFGLTAIRLDTLATVPKPWFWSQPDADGLWSDDKIDDDIWFWKQWREAGYRVHVDPDVSIGHMEEMVAMFDEKMKPHHMYPHDWALSKTNKDTHHPPLERAATRDDSGRAEGSGAVDDTEPVCGAG